MHIKEIQSALLSNHEVFLHLQAEEAEYSGSDGTGRGRKKPAGLKATLRDTLSYLSSPSQPNVLLSQNRSSRPGTLYLGPQSLFSVLQSHLAPNAPNNHDPSASTNGTTNATTKRKPLPALNKAEFLQIMNLCPKTAVELECIIEEGHDRFSVEQMEELVDVIRGVLEQAEADIPAGAEDVRVPVKRKRKVKK
ncbi:hypothetical protein GQ43DRAFT_438056 [Delitschia confertaspora ATCC 74209]|uniref:DNA-directed RNA polymerase III subunit RPC9 n=1 Tax=Delitschia confertaspora ATCC 74209 TaxID=1513339 RepID=A0A9P4JVS6_9PLEO|nr:hypothetical protein GQ43DRAFT_438056 [Delitschia confertaspora ATCC 74209]